jgi:uncharacterized protein (DUF433 family)
MTSGPDPEPNASTLAVIREHIVSTPDTCGGKPRIAGTRIQVKHVAVMHEREGMPPEQIVSEYPHLTLADIYAALAYYHDHREAIDADIDAERAWYERMRAESLEAKLREAVASGPAGPMTREDWDELERAVWDRHRQDHPETL